MNAPRACTGTTTERARTHSLSSPNQKPNTERAARLLAALARDARRGPATSLPHDARTRAPPAPARQARGPSHKLCTRALCSTRPTDSAGESRQPHRPSLARRTCASGTDLRKVGTRYSQPPDGDESGHKKWLVCDAGLSPRQWEEVEKDLNLNLNLNLHDDLLMIYFRRLASAEMTLSTSTH